MKNRKIKKLSVSMLLLLLLTACSSQRVNVKETNIKKANVEKMDEEQRTTYLTNTAKEIYKKYPELYREDAKVRIERQVTYAVEENVANKTYNNPDSPWYGMKPDQTFYSVIFEAGEYSETSTRWYPVSVYIREDTGKAIEIHIDNMIYPVKD